MKRAIVPFAVLALSGMFSCNQMLFNEPQPTEADNLNRFPTLLQGKYYNAAEQAGLTVGDRYMVYNYDFIEKIHKKDVDTAELLTGNFLINKYTGKKDSVDFSGDTLIVHRHYVDTTFHMNYNNVVKRFKGHYFLNNRIDLNGWWVRQLTLSKGVLTLGVVESLQDIKATPVNSESPQDTVMPFKPMPNQQQFRQFLEEGGFQDVDVYLRVSSKK